MAQIEQTNRMIRQQGKDIEHQGGGPGAVMVVQVDYWAVSHAIGIVGVFIRLQVLVVHGLQLLLDYCPLDQRKLTGGFHPISMSLSIAPMTLPTFLQS
jgi:hypothetical protein